MRLLVSLSVVLAFVCEQNEATFLLRAIAKKMFRRPQSGRNEVFPTNKEGRCIIHGVPVVHGVELLRRQQPVINKIEWEIETGREFERNLTRILDVLVAQLEDTNDNEKRRQIQLRLDKITTLLTQIHKRTDVIELRFRTFLHDVSRGEIRTEQQSQTLLQDMWSSYHLSLKDILRPASGFLKPSLIGVGGAAPNLDMGNVDFDRLKPKPIEVSLDVHTGSGPFQKPIRGIKRRR